MRTIPDMKDKNNVDQLKLPKRLKLSYVLHIQILYNEYQKTSCTYVHAMFVYCWIHKKSKFINGCSHSAQMNSAQLYKIRAKLAEKDVHINGSAREKQMKQNRCHTPNLTKSYM